MIEPSGRYPLGYSEDESHRLAAQAAFFEDLTGDVFQRAGIGMGMQVLDLGCGVGDVSFLAAGMVGGAGAVLGIDRNASSIETARHRAMGLGLSNVQFEVSELDAFDKRRGRSQRGTSRSLSAAADQPGGKLKGASFPCWSPLHPP
jgi:cyclopropane fatty-acyl-phospholipid synthase-like methyltransferase